MFDNIIGDAIGSVARSAACTAGGALVAAGLMQQSQLASFEGSVIFLAALGWSVYEKWQSRQTAAPSTTK
jgi:hypothetical protein